MRELMSASLVLVLSSAPPLLALTDCDRQDARPVVEHARKRGYLFELTVASAEGSCWVDSSGYLLFASATTTGDVVCNGRIFAKTVAPEAPAVTAVPLGSGDAPAAPAPAPVVPPPAWEIVGIRIATPDGGDIYPTLDTNGSRRGWTFALTAARGTTQQYRIDTVEFRTQEECTQWRNAF